MKAKLLFFGLFLLAGLIGFNSCDDDDPAALNQEEAEVAIDESNAQYQEVYDGILADNGYKVQDQLGDMILPFNSVRKSAAPSSLLNWKDNLDAAFSSSIKGVEVQEIDFDFRFIYAIGRNYAEYYGTWIWNGSTWDHTASPADQIVLSFPYPFVSKTANNATLTYYDFSSTTTSLSYKGKIELSSVEVLSFSASMSEGTSKYSESLTVRFGVFELVQEESEEESLTQYSAVHSFTITKSGAEVYKQYGTISATRTTDKDAHVVIEAKQRIASLEFRIKLDFNTSDMAAFESGTVDVNEFAKLSLYTTGGAKVGDFKFVYNSNIQDWDLYFVFSNGTEVAAEEVLAALYVRFWGFFIMLVES